MIYKLEHIHATWNLDRWHGRTQDGTAIVCLLAVENSVLRVKFTQ